MFGSITCVDHLQVEKLQQPAAEVSGRLHTNLIGQQHSYAPTWDTITTVSTLTSVNWTLRSWWVLCLKVTVRCKAWSSKDKITELKPVSTSWFSMRQILRCVFQERSMLNVNVSLTGWPLPLTQYCLAAAWEKGSECRAWHLVHFKPSERRYFFCWAERCTSCREEERTDSYHFPSNPS